MTDPRQLQNEVIRRLAVGLDLPAELINGIHHTRAEATNLAALAKLEEQNDQFDSFISQLTRDYLRPALEAAGTPNPERYELFIDDTKDAQ